MGAGTPVPAYRGDGTGRPAVPLPPGRLPVRSGTRVRKRWRYVGVWSPELSLCAARVTVGPLVQEFWAVWDRDGRALHEHTRRLPGRVLVGPGSVRVRDGDVRVDVTFQEGPRGAVEVVAPAGAAYTWTRKQAGLAATGEVRVAGRVLPVAGRATVDDSAGYHPRRTSWRWSTGAGLDVRGRPVAWNLVAGLHDRPGANECTVWVDGQPREVGPVDVADDLSRVRSADGVDLRFTPEAERSRRDDLLLLRPSYRQPFGGFAGLLPGGVELAAAQGVMECHDAVW